MLARTDRFLRVLGAEPFVENFYGAEVGRQYIYRRGKMTDPDYFEKDCFISYSAQFPPAVAFPRIGDIIFRLVHRNVREVYRQLLREDLVRPIGPEGSERRFLEGAAPSLLVLGPDAQRYELRESAPTLAENHAVFIWTDPGELRATIAAYCEQFDFSEREREIFHGVAQVTVLRREESPMSVGLLTPLEGHGLAPRWSRDIFAQVGYSHFRLGSARKEFVKAHSEQVFPDTGDVSYVLFREAYLELVQLQEVAALV
ncbi:hypothetical protein AYO38_10035 [bacterium SCGC AG-212-C10]|nr:hypothetical protein AYO38_10035 [bacterium SCGC AG-212-C10]